MFDRRPEFQRGLDRFEQWAERPVALADFVLAAREELSRLAGVEDLSTIEGVRLRWCVERALELFDDELRKAPGQFGELLNVPREAVYTWLVTSYGLDFVTIQRELFKKGGAAIEFREWLRGVRARAHLL